MKKVVKDLAGHGEAMKPITKRVANLISLFFEPAAKETGHWIGDRIRIARERNIETVLLKAKARLESEKVEIKLVPKKLFLPLVEAAALEDDDDMIERWANLLASAATDNSVLPSYVRLLSELSPAEARILDSVPKLIKDVKDLPHQDAILSTDINDVRNSVPMPEGDFVRVIVSLERLNLLRRDYVNYSLSNSIYDGRQAGEYLVLTEFGRQFLAVCSPRPRAKRDEE